MHEMAIAQGILDIALTANQQEGGGRITKIKLHIGEMTGVEPDALLFCFGALAAGTAASEAKLDIEVIPLAGRCDNCGKEFPIERYRFVCPSCQSVKVETISGRELAVDHLEVE